MNELISQIVRTKTRALLKERGITATKMGEILGAKDDRRSKYSMAERFLSGKRRVTLNDIEKLSAFFEKPVTYFITQSATIPSSLKQSTSIDEHLRDTLTAMGFPESFIADHMIYLKTLQQYFVK